MFSYIIQCDVCVCNYVNWQIMINDHGMVLFCFKDCYSEFDLLFSLRNVLLNSDVAMVTLA